MVLKRVGWRGCELCTLLVRFIYADGVKLSVVAQKGATRDDHGQAESELI